MRRLKIYFSYDGTHYHGFQRQKNVTKTVQEVLESAVSKLTATRVSILSSGRTDAGVHARIQVAHVDLPPQVFIRWNLESLQKALNSILPRDIRIWLIQNAPAGFHAVRSAKKKTYLYFIDPSAVQWPSLRHYSWHLKLPLDWDLMRQTARSFRGTHDFKAFCASNSSAKTSVRHIYEARWGKAPAGVFGAHTELWVFRITGNGFLKHMVRSIVGTLVKIGSHKEDPSIVTRALESGDRRLVGPTAPSRGLWLWDIDYSS